MGTAVLETETQKPAGRTRPRVLCVDSDPAGLEELAASLIENGYEIDRASTPGRALELMASTRPDMIVTEVMFPEMQGIDLLRAIRRMDPAALIIIRSSEPSWKGASERTPGLVFEYVEKSVCPSILISHLRKAYAFIEEKSSLMRIGTGHNDDRLRRKLEWLIWKEKRLISNRYSAETLLLKNMKHSMSQGLGFGGLLTQIELLEMMAKKTDGEVKLPAGSFDALLAASTDLREWLDKLDRVGDILTRTFGLSAMPGSDIERAIKRAVGEVERFREIKGQRIALSDLAYEPNVMCSSEVLTFVLRELFTNAFKYSPEDSMIHVIRFTSGSSVSISIINDIVPMGGGITGIPDEMEVLVFEPFYRINNTYDERFRDEEMGMGIGLSVVQSAISQFGGSLHLYEIVDHATDYVSKKRIVAEITLLIENGAGEGQK